MDHFSLDKNMPYARLFVLLPPPKERIISSHGKLHFSMNLSEFGDLERLICAVDEATTRGGYSERKFQTHRGDSIDTYKHRLVRLRGRRAN